MARDWLYWIARILCILTFFVVPGWANEVLRPEKTTTSPLIDGKLDDALWQNAPTVTGFKTYSPDYGIDMQDQTVVYMAYDRENLYFAFRCLDREPGKIKTSITNRDNVLTDDWVCINLDSFNDQQALYAFYINPAGIQGDSRFASGREDHGVDFVWFSAGALDSAGYTIEVRIPFKSIRFADREPVKMGVIFERRVSRRSEQGTYPPLSPARGMFFLTQMQPVVFHDIKHYKLFELLPAITHRQHRAADAGKLVSTGQNSDLGLTTKYGLTSELILDGTYNPDFSQVEADAGQVDINLRSPLFFDEKRPFFLEGSENFNIAATSNQSYILSMVHTRTIIDPIAGLKFSGRLDRKNLLASILALDEAPLNPAAAADYRDRVGVLRYKRAMSDDNYLGLLYTDREHKNGYNRVLGTDGQLRINESSIFEYHAFGSRSRPAGQTAVTDGRAVGVDYVYATRNLNFNAGLQDITNDFRTDVGFLTRTGIATARVTGTPKFYPRSQWLRRIDPAFYFAYTRDKPSGLTESENTVGVRFTLKGNTSISLNYGLSSEVFLDRKFDTDGWLVSGSSLLTKQLQVKLTYQRSKSIRYLDDPYQGRGSGASATVTYQPSDKLNTNLAVTYSEFFRSADGSKIYEIKIIRDKTTYQMNRYLLFRGIVEYNTYRKWLLTDFLASFTYIPGTVMHFGYGSLYEKIRWQNDSYIASDRFLETNRGFFLKASYLWRL